MTPCDDWRLSAAQCGLSSGHLFSNTGPPTLNQQGLDHHQYSDNDLEPVYATISEVTDNMDQSSLSSPQLFHGLFDVFADLGALRPVDTGVHGGSSQCSSSPPPVISDVPVFRRGAVARPIPSRVDDHRSQHRHTPRLYTYC